MLIHFKYHSLTQPYVIMRANGGWNFLTAAKHESTMFNKLRKVTAGRKLLGEVCLFHLERSYPWKHQQLPLLCRQFLLLERIFLLGIKYFIY